MRGKHASAGRRRVWGVGLSRGIFGMAGKHAATCRGRVLGTGGKRGRNMQGA